LIACHSGEIFRATWQEIDFKNKVWIIPKERVKAKKGTSCSIIRRSYYIT
jgi:hypothetical protein